MTSKLTRERLQEIAEDGFLKHGESKELARMALVAMDSEPVAWTEKCEITNMQATGLYLRGFPDNSQGRDIPLYRHAQQPVVPDDVLDALQKVARMRLDLNDFDGDIRGIADCLGNAEEALIEVVNRRAAMLHAEPVTTANKLGNSPVIPDGYVMAPKEPTAEMIWAAKYVMSSTVGWASFKEAYIAMLAAAPQEVPDGQR